MSLSGPNNQSSWSQNSSNQSSSNAVSQPQVEMLMDQVRSLQQKVLELSESSTASGAKTDCQTAQEINDGRILLVSNLPPTLATCDAVFFMFDRWFE